VYKQPTALVVDDSPELRLVLSSLFKHLGVSVLTARDGQTGLEIAREQHPDIVCLDLMLPTICGLDVCRELKREPATSSTPVVIVSARRFPQDRADARQAGADAYLTKPVSRDEFETRIRSLLWQRQMEMGA
jgi:DNA-binding response OmpR family regulator